MIYRTNKGFLFTVILLLLVVVALFLFLRSTSLSIGTSPDSTIYFSVAKSISSGDGIKSYGQPMTHFPPVYPALIAISGSLNGNFFDGARWLHALIFGLNVFLIGIITYLSTDNSITASLSAILLFLFTAQILRIHIMAWSEPAFIFFSLSVLVLLAFHIIKPNIWLLLGASFFLGLALTTRYIGITLLPGMIIAILFFEDKPFKVRTRDSLILTAIGILPLLIWLLRNLLVTDSVSNRNLVYHSIDIENLELMVTSMYDLWFPNSCQNCFGIPQVLFAIVVVMMLAVFIVIFRGEVRRKRRKSISIVMQTLIVLFSMTYILFLFASISFADAHTPLDFRIMSPVYILGVIFVVSFVWNLSRRWQQPILWWGFLVLLVILVYGKSGLALSYADQLHTEGNGYTSRAWLNSESMAYIEDLPDESTIYSNGPDVIRFLLDRKSSSLPPKIFPNDQTTNPNFDSQLRAMYSDVVQNGAIIIYFENIKRNYLVTEEELKETYEFPEFLRLEDGIIYATRDGN